MYIKDFSRHRDGTGKAYDFALMKELEETRKVVQEAKRAFQSNRGSGTTVLIVNMNLLCFSLCMVLHVMIRNLVPNIDLFIGSCDCLKVVGTVFISIVSLKQNLALKLVLLSFYHLESEEEIHSATKYVTVIPIPQFEHSNLTHHESPLLNGHAHSTSLPNGLNEPPEIIFTSESDSEADFQATMTKSLFSVNSKDSFNTRALTALKELDAAMAAEASDLELGPLGMKRNGSVPSPSQSSTNEDTDPDTDHQVAVPPPPGVYQVLEFGGGISYWQFYNKSTLQYSETAI